jgi:hypothetical protein
MDKIKPLFTASATATGGRNGHTEAEDGSVRADLSVPKAMGGPALIRMRRGAMLMCKSRFAAAEARWWARKSAYRVSGEVRLDDILAVGMAWRTYLSRSLVLQFCKRSELLWAASRINRPNEGEALP